MQLNCTHYCMSDSIHLVVLHIKQAVVYATTLCASLREREEATNDVARRGHMGDFYRNLMAKNVAFGGADAEPSRYALGSAA